MEKSEIIEERPDPKIYHITSYRDRPVTYGKNDQNVGCSYKLILVIIVSAIILVVISL